MENENEWNNEIAIGYLKLALKYYEKQATGTEPYDKNVNLRELTEYEQEKIIKCMYYAFDMKTLREAYEYNKGSHYFDV